MEARKMQPWASYIEIHDNIPGEGIDLNEWNTSYCGCECGREDDEDKDMPIVGNDRDAAKFAGSSTDPLTEQQLSRKINNNFIRNSNNSYYPCREGSQSKRSSSSSCISSCAQRTASATQTTATASAEAECVSCTCVTQSSAQRWHYDAYGRLNAAANGESANVEGCSSNSIYCVGLIIECGDECDCDEEACVNRVVQRGSPFDADLFVFESAEARKGRGVRTRVSIPARSFVADYLGELIGVNEAERRRRERTALGEPNYIMFLREIYSQASSTSSYVIKTTTVIDARNYSSRARFINHSCEPNLFVLPVRVNNSVVPHAALFALRDIEPGEELSYDYNGSVSGARAVESFKLNGQAARAEKRSDRISPVRHTSDGDPTTAATKPAAPAETASICYCGSDNCQGYLPSGFE